MKYKITVKNDSTISSLSAQISKRRTQYPSKIMHSLVPNQPHGQPKERLHSVTKKNHRAVQESPTVHTIIEDEEMDPVESLNKLSTMTVEISNLSRSATETDIKVLLKQYGRIDQLIMKRTGGVFNGKVVVRFLNRPHGQHLISSLNGVVADGIVLRAREVQNVISIAGISKNRKLVFQDTTAGLYSDRIQ